MLMQVTVSYGDAVKRAHELFSKLSRDEATEIARLIKHQHFGAIVKHITEKVKRGRLSALYHRLEKHDLLNSPDAVLHVYWKLRREWEKRDEEEQRELQFEKQHLQIVNPLAPIDHAIEQFEASLNGLELRVSKECPPCWRCKWFEGYLPGNRIALKMEIQDPEVREAVKATEVRKIEIAKKVRLGTEFR